MKPISICLDVLQGEESCYMGCVLPGLTKLKQSLGSLVLSHADEFRLSLVTKFEERFGSWFENNSYKIAAVVHPKFKDYWPLSAEDKSLLKILLQGAVRIEESQETPTANLITDASPTASNFLDFKVPSTDIKPNQIERYLCDSRTEIEILKEYPQILDLFIIHNTTIPSSAPVERLFSHGALVLTAKRTGLSDEHFERSLLLKINKNCI